MKARNWLYWVLVLIAVVTVVTGFVQYFWPGLVLRLVSSEITATTKHFFGIVGMFMVLFGGLLFHALFSSSRQHIAMLWAGLQKFGAAAAVTLGVMNAVFASVALLVAAFDLVSGVLIVTYWLSMKGSR
jgi:hypothetical protein